MPATKATSSSTESATAFILSRRAQQLKPSATLAVSAQVKKLRAAGVDIVAFGVGEPDFDTPANIKQAAIDALLAGQTHYAPVPGEPAAREAIAHKLREENEIRCTSDDIIINVGAKHSLYLILQSLLDENAGHEVVLPTPAWVTYEPQIELAGGTAVQIAGSIDNDFKITPRQLRDALTDNTRAMVFNSPSNPCGTMYSPDEIRALAEVLQQHPHVVVISDEIYEKLIYGDAEHLSIGSLDNVAQQVVTVNGMSKAYAMTGWRVGYACAPGLRTGDGDSLIKAMTRLQGQMTSNITSFLYPAIVTALVGSESAKVVQDMRQSFARRAVLMHDKLTGMPGIQCPKPTGAFYCFPEVSAHFGKKSPDGIAINNVVSFATALLNEAHVAVVPGDDFGECAHGNVRLSYATSDARIIEGCARLRRWLESLQ